MRFKAFESAAVELGGSGSAVTDEVQFLGIPSWLTSDPAKCTFPAPELHVAKI